MYILGTLRIHLAEKYMVFYTILVVSHMIVAQSISSEAKEDEDKLIDGSSCRKFSTSDASVSR